MNHDRDLTCAVASLGCRVNQYEADSITDALAHYGVRLHEGDGSPTFYILNTCAVTKMSDKKSRQLIRRIAREHSQSTLVVTGCFAELEATSVAAMKGVDRVVPNDSKGDIADTLARSLGLSAEPLPLPRNRVRALLKVQEGCDDFCSYCTVPFARGRPRSRDPQEIVDEARSLTRRGARELVLTGTHLGKYGIDTGQTLPALIADLLAELSETDLVRIRLSSLEITELSDALIGLVEGDERVCAHLHIPLQSGSDAILAAMGRRYTAARFEETISRIHLRLPEVAITTDVIVGFPGESDADFDETERLLSESGICRLHVFPFSSRELAPAARLPGHIDRLVKEERAARLSELDSELREDFYRGRVGRSLSVLIEEWHPELGRARGLTADYVMVEVDAESDITGQLLIAEAKDYSVDRLRGVI